MIFPLQHCGRSARCSLGTEACLPGGTLPSWSMGLVFAASWPTAQTAHASACSPSRPAALRAVSFLFAVEGPQSSPIFQSVLGNTPRVWTRPKSAYPPWIALGLLPHGFRPGTDDAAVRVRRGCRAAAGPAADACPPRRHGLPGAVPLFDLGHGTQGRRCRCCRSRTGLVRAAVLRVSCRSRLRPVWHMCGGCFASLRSLTRKGTAETTLRRRHANLPEPHRPFLLQHGYSNLSGIAGGR